VDKQEAFGSKPYTHSHTLMQNVEALYDHLCWLRTPR